MTKTMTNGDVETIANQVMDLFRPYVREDLDGDDMEHFVDWVEELCELYEVDREG